MKYFFFVLIVISVFCLGTYLSNAEKIYTYNKHISPIQVENCYDCHCSIYRFLCNYESMMTYVSEINKKTKGIPLVTPGNPDSSVIIWRLEGKLPSGEPIGIMPASRWVKFSKETIQIYRDWIEQGAIETYVDVDDSRNWGEIKAMFK